VEGCGFDLRPSTFNFPRSGFTVIELLIVVMIMGIMAAVVMPRMGALLEGTKSATAARSVAQLGRYARTMALSTQTPVDFVLETANGVIRTEAIKATEAISREIESRMELQDVRLVFDGYLDRADGKEDPLPDDGVVRIRYRANGTCRPYRVKVSGKNVEEAFTVEVDSVGKPTVRSRGENNR